MLPDGGEGAVNTIRIQRLKDKLGNHANASSEVEFIGAMAWRVGEEASVATDSGSGVASKACGPVVTNTVGSKTVTCTATDNAGNTVNATAPYRVIYRFDGFLQPINDTGHTQACGSNCTVSIFKGGSTVPVKFQLKNANGVVVQSVSLPVWVTPQRGTATNASIDESVYTDPASSGNTFRFDGSQYIYNWSTKGFAAGYYWRIGVRLDDGQTYYVIIGLR